METSTGLGTVIDAMGDVFNLAGTCMDAILGNPILLFFFAAGCIPVGIGIFSMLKNAARG